MFVLGEDLGEAPKFFRNWGVPVCQVHLSRLSVVFIFFYE